MSIRNKLRNFKIFDRLETKYYNITIGIRNIFHWLPIVWQDRPWEYECFTEQFIYRKLKDLDKRNYSDLFEDGDWAQRYLKLCIWLMDEKNRMNDFEDDLYKSINQDDYNNYHDIDMKRRIREKKINHLIYHILETRGGYWWD